MRRAVGAAIGWGLRAVLAPVVLLVGAQSVHAQSETAAVPDDDGVLTVLVAGDSLAADLGASLSRMLAGMPRVTVINRGRASTGLVRNDYYDWPAAARRLVAEFDIDVAVISVGMNDRQGMAVPGAVYPRFSDEWRAEYADRAESVMAVFRDAGVEVFWMGMPIAQSASFSDGMRVINEIMAETADRAGVTFVETWDLTTDAQGNYTAYAVDGQGRSRPIRHDDGFHLTAYGTEIVIDRVLGQIEATLGARLITEPWEDVPRPPRQPIRAATD